VGVKKAMVMLRKILLLSSLFITATHAADKNLYLFDVLKDPKYLSSWNGLFKDEVGVDDWLKNYAEWLDGPSSHGKNVIVAGRQYMIHNVCEAHNCGSNYFLVAFSEDASTALGLQMRMKYVRVFDFKQNKFVGKQVRENRFFGAAKFDKTERIIKLKKLMIESRKLPR
jgi:hypothetical protein